ncbi:MAG: hypothetical protein II007_03020 [Gammaproteobacteria bacterium]|nr:hypothetical protein [Gammaproteobacteria bacterium]
MTTSRVLAYQGRPVLVATRHGKADPLQRPFGRCLGVNLWSPADLDTDRFGTFSGEVARPGSPEAMLHAKIQLARAEYDAPLALASEGSYGPHPWLPGAALGQEWLLWQDAEQNLTVMEQLWTLRVHYGAYDVSSVAELRPAMQRCGWPQLALTLATSQPGLPVYKALRDLSEIEQCWQQLQAASGSAVVVATDMRAHLHPGRQRAIGRLGARLAHRLACSCPACGRPGFGRWQWQHGLPCADCDSPTSQRWRRWLRCDHCGHGQPQSAVATSADPRWCPRCNP